MLTTVIPPELGFQLVDHVVCTVSLSFRKPSKAGITLRVSAICLEILVAFSICHSELFFDANYFLLKTAPFNGMRRKSEAMAMETAGSPSTSDDCP